MIESGQQLRKWEFDYEQLNKKMMRDMRDIDARLNEKIIELENIINDQEKTIQTHGNLEFLIQYLSYIL